MDSQPGDLGLIFVETHESLMDAYESLVESCESLVESCESLMESYESLVESCESLVESCESLIESCESLVEHGAGKTVRMLQQKFHFQVNTLRPTNRTVPNVRSVFH